MAEEEALDGLQIEQFLNDHKLAPTTAVADLEEWSVSLAHLQRLAGLGTLAASVAHELSNPMSIITATVNNLLSQVADDELNTDQLLHYIEMVDHSAWRCARLIQTLRTYAHAETAQPVETNLNRLIEDGLSLVTYQFQRQFQVDIEIALADDLPLITCDPNQIIQVLVNLLLNARDALPATAGVIQVKTAYLRGERAVSFAVCDSGTGLDPAIMDRIFEPFFTTKAVGKGTGLGLSIAATIVKQHHGRLEAANNPGGGATFTVTLPLQSGRNQ